MPEKLLNKAIFSDFTEIGTALQSIRAYLTKLLKRTYGYLWSWQDRIH